ncbi:MAG: cupin domain-containing protein [Planctomycetes bacterium]|nr:cupin domain-containing protein [Planctomycetota bacterium]
MRKRDFIRNLSDVEEIVAKDTAKIREIFHPKNSQVRLMSLAFGELDPGRKAVPHRHAKSTAEEYYFILSGSGFISLGGRIWRITVGDAIFIPAGWKHGLANDSNSEPLWVLAVESPPYSDEGTSFKK